MREIAAIFTSKKSKRTVTHLSGSPFCVQQMQQRSERQINFFLCAVLQGFQHRIFVEELLSGQVGDGAGNPEDTVMGAGREAQRVVRSAEELLGTGGHPADPAHLPGRELGVAADTLEAGGGITPGLDLAGLQHLLAQGGTALGRGGGVKLIEGNGVHLDAEVDAVEQRAGHPAAVLPHRAGRAGAGAGGVAVVAALAGIHGGYQLEPAGVGGAASGAADRDLAVFQRLAEHFEALAGKLRQLVQKQDAAVGQTAFAGAEVRSAASQRSGTGRVMRAAEGPMGDEPAPFGQLPGDGVDLGRLHSLFTAERRQDAGQTPGQHGFASAGCADQKHVVPACGGNDHGPAGEGLAHDVCQVRGIVPALGGVEGLTRH